MQGGFEGMYQENAKDSLGETGKETFEAVNFLKQANPGAIQTGKRRGLSEFALRTIAAADRAVDQSRRRAGSRFYRTPADWDTHANEGNGSRGQLANLLRDFGASIAALATDLGKKMDDVVILTMSEFGRTARENGSRGTDHGHGNAMFVIGNSVKGGKVYGDWKGLKQSQLNEGRDLAVTTDFRDVFAEVASKHLGNKNLDKIFPNYPTSSGKFRGFLG